MWLLHHVSVLPAVVQSVPFSSPFLSMMHFPHSCAPTFLIPDFGAARHWQPVNHSCKRGLGFFSVASSLKHANRPSPSHALENSLPCRGLWGVDSYSFESPIPTSPSIPCLKARIRVSEVDLAIHWGLGRWMCTYRVYFV